MRAPARLGLQLPSFELGVAPEALFAKLVEIAETAGRPGRGRRGGSKG
jgi:hypothetical protein